MKKFYSLREFLLLLDPLDDPPFRSIHQNEMMDDRSRSVAEDMVKRYDLAKASWEKYGEGPPVGSKVITIRSGFGGSAGRILTLNGVHKGYSKCFSLEDEKGGLYSSTIQCWWSDFKVE